MHKFSGLFVAFVLPACVWSQQHKGTAARSANANPLRIDSTRKGDPGHTYYRGYEHVLLVGSDSEIESKLPTFSPVPGQRVAM